jgi:hypothetical protein
MARPARFFPAIIVVFPRFVQTVIVLVTRWIGPVAVPWAVGVVFVRALAVTTVAVPAVMAVTVGVPVVAARYVFPGW